MWTANATMIEYVLHFNSTIVCSISVLQGVFTMPDSNPLSTSHKSAENLPRILRRVKEYSGLFSERAQAIVHSLQVHQDLDCRFLSIRLNFSDFYRTKKELKAASDAQNAAKLA